MTMVVFEISKGNGSKFTPETSQNILIDLVRYYAHKPDSHPYLTATLKHLSSLDPSHFLKA